MMLSDNISGLQIRMARSALRWRIDDLADAADVTWARLQAIEKTDGVPSASTESLDKIREVLEGNGIVFVDDGNAAGVMLKGVSAGKD